MIILDTNIVSEMMKTDPSTAVLQWMDQQEAIQLFITTITIAEISYGLHALPDSNRRKYLEDAFNRAIMNAFKHRILPFEESSAHIYGKIMGHRKKLGRPLSIPDGQIASITLSQGFSLATRNIRDFSHCDIDLMNPFEQ